MSDAGELEARRAQTTPFLRHVTQFGILFPNEGKDRVKCDFVGEWNIVRNAVYQLVLRGRKTRQAIFLPNGAKDWLHFGLIPMICVPKSRLGTRLIVPGMNGQIFSQNVAKDLEASDMETIRNRLQSLQVSRASNSLSKIQLVQGGSLNRGYARLCKKWRRTF
jgi:hypothetical protein